VQRNRVKRALREAFRRHPVKFAGLDLVVMFRVRIEPSEERAVVDEIKGLLDQARGSRP
jgi:ribonuclease P protein component